jgi:hypothetical protein
VRPINIRRTPIFTYITYAQKDAGRSLPRRLDTRDVVSPVSGGSEASPTWKKSPINILKKKTPGDVVKSDNKIVKVSDTNSNSQRASFASQVILLWKVKDDGKLESKGMLSMPFLLELWKLVWYPTRETTPHPPTLLLMTPAWIAALQMKESLR